MSVRTCMHYMTHTGGPLPKIELRPHPTSDTLHLTLVLADQDFTWSDTAERMRELFKAILAEPLLAIPQTQGCGAVSPWGHFCVQKAGHDGNHATGGQILQWDAAPPPSPAVDAAPAVALKDAVATTLGVHMLRLLRDGVGPGGGYYEAAQRLPAAVALLEAGWSARAAPVPEKQSPVPAPAVTALTEKQLNEEKK